MKKILITIQIFAVLLLGGAGPVFAKDPVQVTASNYVRAESDIQMKGYIESFNCFGKFHHNREAYDVNNQITIRGNRDTIYSFGVFDLRSPVTITLPETGGRYQSLMVVSQDHSIWSFYGPKTGTLTEDKVGTRYATLTVRTFADPNDEEDMKEAYRLQDAVKVEQADIGTFEVPDWKKEEVEKMRETINVVASTVTDSSKFFGRKENLDPVYWMLGAALGWGGLPGDAATYAIEFPEKNDGKTPYTLTVTDVPVYGFWSVTLYDDKGYMPANDYNAYSFKRTSLPRRQRTAAVSRSTSGAIPRLTTSCRSYRVGTYIVRMYKPGPEILKGT